MNRISLLLHTVLIVTVLTLISCRHDKKDIVNPGKVKLVFSQTVDGSPLVFDSAHYINAAGNEYLVNELQYFVSDIDLYNSDGSVTRLKRPESQDVYYIDSHLPSTWSYNISDAITAGSYDSIAFTFGIISSKNLTGLFVNPPEVNMFWPDFMGGGYHYMKMNGTWLDPSNQMQPFNFHMGIGTDNVPVPPVFIDNSFRVHLPSSVFTLAQNELKTININMNIENWFQNPHLWDWNVTGGAIMQSQTYMQMAKENGWDVFNVKL